MLHSINSQLFFLQQSILLPVYWILCISASLRPCVNSDFTQKLKFTEFWQKITNRIFRFLIGRCPLLVGSAPFERHTDDKAKDDRYGDGE